MAAGMLATAAAPWLEAQSTTSPREKPTTITPSQEPVPLFALDLEALLTAPNVLTASIDDGVWTVTPRPLRQRSSAGRRSATSSDGFVRPAHAQGVGIAGRGGTGGQLLLLPLRIIPPAQPATLKAATLRVKGGRFVAWKLSDHSLAPGANADPTDGPAPPQPSADDPTFVREVVVEPDGALRWRLDRKVPGGELKATESGYDLKIDPKRIVTVVFNAGFPPPKPTGELTREDKKRWRDSVADYHRATAQIKKQNAAGIRAMTQQAKELPDEFVMAMPQRIWAVFDVGSPRGKIVVHAVGIPRWHIEYSHLRAMRGGTGVGAGGRFGTGGQTAARAMFAVAGREDPLSQRFVAHALSRSNQMAQIKVDDDMFRVVKKMIDSPDTEARQTVIAGLLRTAPTEATNQLVAAAVPRMDESAKLDWLRLTLGVPLDDESQVQPGAPEQPGRLRQRFMTRIAPMPVPPRQSFTTMSPDSSGRAALAVAAANQLLQDPEGPEPQAIIELLVRHGGPNDSRRKGGGLGGPMADDIRFDRLEGPRRDGAIGAVVRFAGTSPLAAYWLDKRLLADAADRALQRQTVQTLANAYGWHNAFTMTYERMADAMFGRAADASQVAAVRIEAPITLDSAQHGLFSALLHGDAQIRNLAWRALPQFTLPHSARGIPGQSSSGAEDEALATLLTVARSQRHPSRQVIEFLRRQPVQSQGTRALVSLAADVESPLSAMAGHALIGSRRPIGEVLSSGSFSPDDLHGFAQSVYGGDGEAPRVTGLIRSDDPQRPIVRWFADRVAAGRLPTSAEWGPKYGTTDQLVALAASSNAVIAEAAAAALAAYAGAGDDQVPAILKAIRSAGDSQPDRLEQWTQLRGEINARRMQESAGPYMLTLRIYPAPEGAAALRARGPLGVPMVPLPGPMSYQTPGQAALEPPTNVPPEIDRDLGIVHLTVEGQTVYLGNQTVAASIPEDHLAIEIEDPNELKNLVDDLGQLPLDELAAIELLSFQQSDWRGVFVLPDGRTAVLLLRRART